MEQQKLLNELKFEVGIWLKQYTFNSTTTQSEILGISQLKLDVKQNNQNNKLPILQISSFIENKTVFSNSSKLLLS